MGRMQRMRNTFNQDRTYGHINLATGNEAPHVVKWATVYTRLEQKPGRGEVRQEWSFGIRLPMEIADALESADWELVCRRLDTRVGDKLSPIEAVIVSALMWGADSHQMQQTVCQHIAQNLYRIYCFKQRKAGNSAWLAPTAMEQQGEVIQ